MPKPTPRITADGPQELLAYSEILEQAFLESFNAGPPEDHYRAGFRHGIRIAIEILQSNPSPATVESLT